ncbi:MAG: DNA-binding protein [Pigmentiphaga sp.]
MSKIGVQSADVWEAADRVLMSGQRPTIERVRQDLGRGSPNTVGPHLDAWYQQLGQRLHAATAPESSEAAMPAALQDLVKELWQTARQQAGQQVEQKNRQVEAGLAEQGRLLEQAQQETMQQQQQLQQREADLNAHIVLLQEQLKLADQRLDESLRIQTEKEVQLESARRANAEIGNKKQVLEAEILRLRDEHEAALRQLSSEHHRQLTRWMAEVDRARQEKKQLESESAQALAALKQAIEQQEAGHRQARHALEAQLAAALESSQRHQQQWREALKLNQQQQQEREQLQQRIEMLNRQQMNAKELFAQFAVSVNASLAARREPRQQQGGRQQTATDSEPASGSAERLD